jgi:hypothetical protein
VPGRRQAVTAYQQPEPVIQAVQHLRHTKRLNPRRGQLDRQRHPIQPLHEARHQRPGLAAQGEMRVNLPRPVSEQGDSIGSPWLGLAVPVGQAQRRQPIPRLRRHPNRLPACRQNPHIIRCRQQRRAQSGHRRNHVLAVVQDQQDLPARHHPRQQVRYRHPGPLADP